VSLRHGAGAFAHVGYHFARLAFLEELSHSVGKGLGAIISDGGIERNEVRYPQRISGPLLDRIDIHVEVPLVEYRDLAKTEASESSADIRERVEAAR
jgi:hypothetical protein